MRRNRVMLVNPPYSGARVKVVFCAGLGYVAQTLKERGFEYDLMDMSRGYTLRDLKKKIEAFRPDLIGVSLMTYRYKESYCLIKNMKQAFPQIPIVAGGPHVSLFRQQVLTECAALDFGVVLEGEETLIELCQGNPPDTIKGLIYRSGPSLTYSGDRAFMKDLDSIPFPRYEKFELEKRFKKEVNALPIVSSRGCPFDCIYCPVQYSIGQEFRARSPESIMQELSFWYEQGYRIFSFADDNFTLLKERVYKLCSLLKKSPFKDIRLSCDNGIRADKVDKELLAFMKKANFYRLAFGVEAGNDKVLKRLHKNESIEVIKQRIREACDLGYEVDLFFLVGSPGETMRDLEDSFRIAQTCPIGTANFYNIIPFPHTKLFDWIKENGTFLKKPSEYLDKYPILDNDPLFETKEMSYRERRRALGRAFGIMRHSMRRSWAKRLDKFGALGRFLAFIYTSAFVQDVLLRHKISRRVVYRLAGLCFQGGKHN
jgi:anaerobic magnesium-protoporphyrin IX monomethyl ester cyclase